VNIFDLREQLVTDYGNFIRGFLKIRDVRLNAFVHRSLDEGVFWPEPYISLNPNFASGGYVDDLVAAGTLHHRGCLTAFRRDKENAPGGLPLRLHRHRPRQSTRRHRVSTTCGFLGQLGQRRRRSKPSLLIKSREACEGRSSAT